jgi:hypothetical protein
MFFGKLMPHDGCPSVVVPGSSNDSSRCVRVTQVITMRLFANVHWG